MVDSSFGSWLAGFIDGEGCFYITRDSKRGVLRARFSLSLRADDHAILEEIKRRTGIGTIHQYDPPPAASLLVSRWVVQSRADTEELVRLLTKYPLRAKKAKDFDVWCRAVDVQRAIRSGRADNSEVTKQMEKLKQELAKVRQEGLKCL